jgi:hypothetical protein
MPLIDRLSTPPTRVQGVFWATAAALMMIGGGFGWSLLLTESDPEETIARAFIIGNIIALLGFVPFLMGVYAFIGRRATPVWLLVTALGILVVRALVLLPELWTVPEVFYDNQAWGYAFLLLTGVAAGLAAVAWLPETEHARRRSRVLVVGVGVGLFVALTLFAFAPYVAPVSAVGLAIALTFRRQQQPVTDED